MTLRPCRPGECKREELADWGIYDGCFPRGIAFTDIDGITDGSEVPWRGDLGLVEEGFRFLFIDRKKDTDNPRNFRWGQEQAFTRLATLRRVTFITEILHADDTHTWRIRCGGWDSGWRKLTRAEARKWMAAWSDLAEGLGPRPSADPGRPAEPPVSYTLAFGADFERG